MPTGDIPRSAPSASRGASKFEPSVALAILDGWAGVDPEGEAGSAWDAAWIACLTNSPRWAETAWREFARATGGRWDRTGEDRRPAAPPHGCDEPVAPVG